MQTILVIKEKVSGPIKLFYIISNFKNLALNYIMKYILGDVNLVLIIL